MPVGMSGAQMAKEWMVRIKKRIPPKVVVAGPVTENVVESKDVDLAAMPAPTLSYGWWTVYAKRIVRE